MPAAPAEPDTAAAALAADAKPAEIKPDLSDLGVVRAQQNLNRIRPLVQQGVLPVNDLAKAQDELNNALDMSILRYSVLATDLLPDQADQMVTVAERMYLRSQKRAMQTRQLLETGILARSEAEASISDVTSAKLQLDLAIERAGLVKEMALQKHQAEIETEAESQPEWNGQIYTRYDGNGTFTRADFNKDFVGAYSYFRPRDSWSAPTDRRLCTRLLVSITPDASISRSIRMRRKASGCFATCRRIISRITRSGPRLRTRLPARIHPIWMTAATPL